MELGVETSSSAVVTGKRTRRPSELVLHLAGSASPVSAHTAVSDAESAYAPEDDVPADKRRFHCAHAGCDKAYAKPARLREHERVHTGERPYTCARCAKAFRRLTHLQAHARAHEPEGARPLACAAAGCARRFWTAQHLRAHARVHGGPRPFACTHSGCDAAFAKHAQLRAHVAAAHCAPGTKPFRCGAAACGKSFATGAKLRAHLKTHDERRYACVQPACAAVEGGTYFRTWSALQAHGRAAHPPVCPDAGCAGRTFATRAGLRAHLKLHEQREVECALLGDGERACKRRRGGEVGRDWACEAEGCGKEFKSKYALTTHVNVAHLQRRDFVCADAGCGMDFGYKRLLQRHVGKAHAGGADADGGEQRSGEEVEEWDSIDVITGKHYADASKGRVAAGTGLRCPHPDTAHFLGGEGRASGISCDYVFSRAYDLGRHLRTAHEVEAGKEAVDEWVQRARAGHEVSG